MRERARAPTARGYGAGARHRATSGPLAARFRLSKREEGKEKPSKRAFQTIFFRNYLTNTNVLRFNSTFTFLSNTNVHPVALVRPM